MYVGNFHCTGADYLYYHLWKETSERRKSWNKKEKMRYESMFVALFSYMEDFCITIGSYLQ